MSDSTVEGPLVVPAHSRSVVREIALTVGAVAGLLCVMIALSALLFGITPLVFRSGSMSPAIETGALAVSKKAPASDVRVGDVVNVRNAAGEGITHRVVEIGAISADSVELFLQGDANAERDSEPYIVTDAGRVVFSVPKLGYVVTWLSGPVAVFAGGVLVGALLMVAFRPEGTRKPAEQGTTDTESFGRHSKSTSTAILVVVTVAALGVSTSNAPDAMAAPLGDTAVATSGTFTTVLARPTNFNCSNRTLSTAQLSWSSNPAYSYEITVNSTATPISLAPAPGTTRTWNTGDAGQLLSLGAMTFTLRARVGNVLSASAGTWTVNFTTFLLSSCGSFAASSAGASARLLPQSQSSEPAPTTQVPMASKQPSTTSVTEPPVSSITTSTTPPPTTTTTTESAPAPPETPDAPTATTTPVPANLISPQTSPSGASTAQVVELDGAPTLQIVDSAGAIQYSAPATSSDAYGYGVNWAAGDQLWLLGPDQLVRLDSGGGSWTRTLVDPAATDQIPAGILALIK